MYGLQPSLQRLFLFGENNREWLPFDKRDWHVLGLPDHLKDQVFQIMLSRIGPARIFEVAVSEQCPKDAYTHLARGVRKLGIPYAVIFVIHARSASPHLIFWRNQKPDTFHHMDLQIESLGEMDREVLDLLRTLNAKKLPDLFHLLEGQALGSAFYRTLKTQMNRLGPLDPNGHRAMVDLLLKLIFLVFVQRKGWLNFNPHYLGEKMDLCIAKKLSIVTMFFKPLFARLEGAPIQEVLNPGDLPVLAGGMFGFQPHHLPPIPNHWCRELYESLVSHFSFSLFEAGAGRRIVGISPEMLGHVFERLLTPGDRKSQGTFYTPSHIAEKQAEAAFQIQLGPLLKQGNRRALLKALRQIRILDPSCGSGAYLVAAFQVLLRHRLSLAPDPERYNGKLYALKRDIVQTNLFGVDINPMAVRLSEVRLWLNMIQDLEISHPAKAPILPNLQHHLRPGDFLARYDTLTTPQVRKWPKYGALLKLRQKFPATTSTHRQKVLNHIYRLEHELYQFISSDTNQSSSPLQEPLPGHSSNQPKPPKQTQDPVQGANLHVVFSEIMLNGGFDLILGNPPWRAASRIDKPQKHRLAALELPNQLKLSGQSDLSLYFLAAGLRYLKPNGHLGFMLPGKFLQAKYGAPLRAHLEQTARIDYIYDYSSVQGQIFKADTFPIALGVSAREAVPDHLIDVERHGTGHTQRLALSQTQLTDPSSIWVLDPDPNPDRDSPRLKDTPHRIRRGVKTECKRHFVFDRLPDHIPRERIRPLLRGRDIRPNHASPGAWIYWPFSAGPDWYESAGPAEREWLNSTGKLIWDNPRPRLKYRPKPMGPHILVWKYLSREWTVALLKWDDNWIPDQTTYYINFKTRREALPFYRFFNTKDATQQLQRLAERAKDHRFFYYAHTCEELTIPWPA